MRPIAILTAMASAIFAQSFPLIGKEFLFFDGGNKSTFSLLENVNPRRAFLVYFKSNTLADITWARFDGLYFNNTKDIEGSLQSQFNANIMTDVPAGDLFNTSPIPGWQWSTNASLTSRWSCRDPLYKLSQGGGGAVIYSDYTMTGRQNGAEVTVTNPIVSLASDTNTFDERPECYVHRVGESPLYRYYQRLNGGFGSVGSAQVGEYQSSSCSDGYCSLSQDIPPSATNPVNSDDFAMNAEQYDSAGCVTAPTACNERSYYDDANAVSTPVQSPLYVLHLFPLVTWRPRNVLSGGIHTGIQPTSTTEMRALRTKALTDPTATDPVSAGWRSPLIDTNNSAITSVIFRPTDYLSDGNLVLKDAVSSIPKWNHFPAVAVQYKDATGGGLWIPDMNWLMTAALQAFSYPKPRYSFYSNISANCGVQWWLHERMISYKLYGRTPITEKRTNSNIPYCFTDSLDEVKAMTDGREATRLAQNKRPCVHFSLGPITNTVTRWKLNIDPATGQKYELSSSLWHGCPDKNLLIIYNAKYLTRNTMMDMLTMPYPRCSTISAAHACEFYDYAYNYFINYPTEDPSGDLADYANRRRKVACPDVGIIKRQIAAITNPALLPNASNCSDLFANSTPTYPHPWTPTIPMEQP